MLKNLTLTNEEMDEIQEAIDEANGVEFPGLYG